MKTVGTGGKIIIWKDEAMNDQLSQSENIDLGTQGKPKTFYVEGLEASSLLGDVQIEVTYAKADGTYTCADKIALTVVKSDLDVDANYDGVIDEYDDPLEVSAGGFTATNVLREINFAAFPGPHKLTSGGVILSAEAGGDKIKVWADPNKTTEITFDPKLKTSTQKITPSRHAHGDIRWAYIQQADETVG